ncbi:izumo sperm-egg fusion protein 1 isoform X1 [Poeciliopsis prolifica]|uniref:izumo sperm-egg fusion protein 1 isoform X1 n=1 Tax=Poeciliopsis prolifica TaxID=188132 RepID=UPI002413293F|nr:izumo sperm-egg fusion protein 1 isoform X1 [Poeciliopsis prolifica]XP_054895687.1 izumo sperm-egg fusion protein 1 isoform X1 [Poeciliopsis prolifica]
MLLVVVLLLHRIVTAEACLQCDRTIKTMHEDYILSASSVAEQITFQMISDQAFVSYKKTSQSRKGVIDPTTLYRAKTEYQSEFHRFLNAPRVEAIKFETIQIMEKGRQILEKHLDIFIPKELCPNKCGFLKRRVLDCVSCKYKTYVCPVVSDQLVCDVHTVQGEEEGQVVLNCFLPWHRFILGKPEYHYSRAIGEADATKLTEKDFQPLVVTQDASIILNQLHLDEQGTYRCSLQDENGAVYYRAAFLLTVEPLALQTRQPFVTLPPLAHGVSSTENRLVVLIVVVTALSLAASVGLIVLLRTMMNRQKQVKDMRIKKNGKRTKATV